MTVLALLVSSTDVLIFIVVACHLQQTANFFQADTHAVILNKLALTSPHCSISNYTLKGLSSNKLSHKQINISPKHLSSATTNQIRPDLRA